MKTKVVLITDCIDVALLEMRGAIYSNANTDNFDIEPIVQVQDYNIVNTAFLFDLIVNAYPPGTIISLVVNPVQLRTERIAGRLLDKDIIFEGTNTGALGYVIEKYGCSELYEINDTGFVPFGGKYIHAPTVGKIVSGVPLKDLGKKFDINRVRNVSMNDGTIVHKDNFGNIKFFGNINDAKNGDKYTIQIKDQKFIALYWKRMMECNDGTLVIYPGSSFGLPEIGIVRGNFAEKYNINPGDIVIYNKFKENDNE